MKWELERNSVKYLLGSCLILVLLLGYLQVYLSESNFMIYLKSILFFVVAGLFEIGGGYLVWLWLREGKNIWYGITGGIILALYGIIPTFQPGNFERVYAAYGGVFVVMSILWGWKVDQVNPDRFDLIGAAIVLLGIGIIMYWPRH